jgi:hypothetical protein
VKFICLTFLSLVLSCAHKKLEGDRDLKKQDRPEFLKKYEKFQDVEFFEKNKGGVKFYEVKYENKKNAEVSLSFDLSGNLLEREEDLEYSELPLEVRQRITAYIDTHYQQAMVHETERRIDKDGRNLVDVEIRHESSASGYWELTFDQDGNYLSREKEDHDPINTLN